MADVIDLLSAVTPSLKIGWVLWLAAGGTIWFLSYARATPLPMTVPSPAKPMARPPVQQKTPWDLTAAPDLSAGFSAASEARADERDRPAKKSRRRRRTTD